MSSQLAEDKVKPAQTGRKSSNLKLFRYALGLIACALALSDFTAAQASCSVTYAISNSWPGGFQAAISIMNTGPIAISGWTLQWTFSGNQQITNLWGGTVTSTGQAVKVVNASYDGTIPAGAGVSGIGFVANSTGTNAIPTAFTLNGTVCGGGNSGPPPAPTGLTANAVSTALIALAWSPVPVGSVTYNVYRSTVTNFVPSASTRIASGLANPNFQDNGVATSTTYFYRVAAVNSSGESAASNQASASTQLLITSISPTSGVVGSSVGIGGSAFGASQGSSRVNFGTIAATVTAWSSGSITANVPNLSVGAVSVSVAVGGVTSNPVQFTVTNTPPTTFTGNATHFDALGTPYGGCGLPQSVIDSQNFVALNVQDTPGNYTTSLPRPIPAQFANEIGKFNNGHNCGRWVHVVIGNFCQGTNDGAPGQPFCRGGAGWVADQYNGAALDMVVADSCQDGNAWCRDDPNHLDLVTSSLNTFLLNGQPVGNMNPDHWNNRQITWQFIPAPNYAGDIKIGFLQGANAFWSAIGIAHLPNGIHGVEYFSNGSWQTATMDADLGDDYIVLPTSSGGTQYQVRVRDVTDQLINNGRVYLFSFPASCGSQCGPPFTQVPYTVQ